MRRSLVTYWTVSAAPFSGQTTESAPSGSLPAHWNSSRTALPSTSRTTAGKGMKKPFRPLYDILCMANGARYHVVIDATSGKVIDVQA